MRLTNYNKKAGVVDPTFWFIVGAVWVVHAAFIIGYAMVPDEPPGLNPIQEHAQQWQSPFPK